MQQLLDFAVISISNFIAVATSVIVLVWLIFDGLAKVIHEICQPEWSHASDDYDDDDDDDDDDDEFDEYDEITDQREQQPGA
jgi:hypothetical protein